MSEEELKKNTEEEATQAEEASAKKGPIEERLQKIIAMRGYCSRRIAEKLITNGKVKVNGQVVTELGAKFPIDCELEVEGKNLLAAKSTDEYVYLAVNKPLGFICTTSDPQGRKLVTDLVPPKYGRVFPVGRLDINSEGLIFLTNDGEFSNLLMHPSSAPSKIYRVKIDSSLTRDQEEELKHGIMLEDGMTAPCELKRMEIFASGVTYEITLHEGKNREIRRMMDYFGKKVINLTRIQIGPIAMGNLHKGSYVVLPPAVVNRIKKDCMDRKAKNTYVPPRKYGE